MKGTKLAQLDKLDREAVVPVKDVAVGDVIEFIGGGMGKHGGLRFATITKIYPRLRVVRVEKCVGATGRLLWTAAVHETRIMKNYGAVKREVI